MFIDIDHVMRANRDPAGGERLAGTPMSIKLDLLCEGKPAYYVGDELQTEAVEANWREALEFARELLGRSADLGVLMRLAAACLRERNLVDFGDCLEVMAQLVEHHWTSCYPELDDDEDGSPPDASVRLGVLSRLDDDKLILLPLAAAMVTDEAIPGAGISLVELPGAVVDSAAKQRAADLLDALHQKATRIEQAVTGHSPDDADFSVHRFKDACLALRKRVQAGVNTAVAEAAAAGDAAAGVTMAPPSGVDAALGREHAAASLRAIIAYFERAEPSSPVIGILERALDFIGKDFWTIMSELGEQRLVDAVEESRLFTKRQ